MLSRVADSLYWMCRYIERAENTSRFIGVNLNLQLDLATMSEDQQWSPLIAVTGDESQFFERYREATQANVLEYLTFDPENPNSICSCLVQARENARTIREVISTELWEQVNRFYRMLTAFDARDAAARDLWTFYNNVKLQGHMVAGIMLSSMTHNEGWHFARAGQLLERADMTSRLLDVKYFILLPKIDFVGTPLDKLHWAAVLKSASALEMYRKRHRAITPESVVDFLLLNTDFPRSVHYCLIRAEDSLHSISGTPPRTFSNRAEQALGRLRGQFSYTTLDEIFERGIHEFLDELQAGINDIGEAIFDTYFAMRPV